ncbi:twin-arginine translocase TatA/TatE family subunit [Phycisphaerales bacterium AB-hyl4]|uniref:Sec-independent protein translocase protein TatA n=1 Tax=Natronomicrosphaera hydrolytica TaxID=3242702 RepID=A0ABV4UBH8_9BACT
MPDTLLYSALGFVGPLGWPELLLLALLGVLIFGKRLPEVGKSIGRGIVEFKKGLSGIEDGLDEATKQSPQIEQHQRDAVDTKADATDKSSANHSAPPSTP